MLLTYRSLKISTFQILHSRSNDYLSISQPSSSMKIFIQLTKHRLLRQSQLSSPDNPLTLAWTLALPLQPGQTTTTATTRTPLGLVLTVGGIYSVTKPRLYPTGPRTLRQSTRSTL